MRRINIIFIAVLGFWPSTPLTAQNKFQFDHLTSEDGLLDNMTFSIFQDSKNYIWIGGKAGLQRYDGYEFLNFTYNVKNPKLGLQEMMIRHIMESSDGTIWVGTAGGGISRYKDGRLLPHILHDPNDPNSLAGSYIENIIEDKVTGGMWFATDKGLDYFIDGKFTHYQHNPNNSQSISDNQIFSLEQDAKGNVWVGTQNGLNLHKGGGKFQRFHNDPEDPNSISADFIHDMMIDSQGNLWLAIVQGGVSRMDLSNYSATQYMHDPTNTTSISGNVALNLAEDPEGNIWIATYGAGLNKFSDGDFEVFKNNALDKTTIANDNVEEVMVDREGNIWTANYLGGVNRYAERQIVSYTYNNYKDQGMISTITLTDLMVTSDGAVWFGISSGGLNRYINGVFEQIPLETEDIVGLSSLRIDAIMEDSRGRIWVANHGGGADMISNGDYTHFKHDPSDPNGIHSDEIVALSEDANGDIWFGSNRRGISIYNNDGFKTYTHNPNDTKSLCSNNVNSMFSMSDGSTWIATEEGLCEYKNGSFTTYKNNSEDPFSLPKDNIIVVAVDNMDNVWVGFDGGIAMLDQSTGKFTTYNEEDGLAGSVVEDLAIDADGNVWAATHNGASRYNYSLGQFESFTTKHGFIDNSVLNIYTHPNSRKVYFGGPDGFYFLDLDHKSKTDEKLELTITDFSLTNDVTDSVQLIIKEQLSKGEYITLNYNQNTFEIKYAALTSEIKPNHNYSYRMKNLNDDWTFAGNMSKVSYTYLEPGDYTFEVKLLGAEEQSAIKSLSFTILAPWWKTIWFRGLVIMVVLASVVWFYKIRSNQIKQNAQELQKKVQEATEQVNAQNDVLQVQSENLQQAIVETNFVINQAVDSGNFSARIDLEAKEGEWKKLGASINLLFETVLKPINAINEVVNKMSEGDLTQRYTEEAKGDILLLSENLNKAMDSLVDLLRDITSQADVIGDSTNEMLVTSEEMTISTGEIASAIGEMSTGAQDQVGKVDESSNLIEGILLSSSEMGDQADAINRTASKGVEKSDEGMALISSLDVSMKGILANSAETNKSIETLSIRSQEITGVLTIIKEIASQTNLLALNAAIEAAQAGDAGRGFAVVAEEIRKLAEDSKKSAGEIEDLIKDVQRDTGATVKLISEMNKSIKEGEEVTRHSMSSFKEIYEYYAETLEKSEQIVSATKQQTDDIGIVLKTISGVVVIAEETAAGTEETASSASQLSSGMTNYTEKSKNVSEIIKDLKEKVERFKLS